MKLLTEKKREIGRTLSRNILRIELDGGGTMMLGGNEYTAVFDLPDGDSLTVICNNGEIATDILPKEDENVEQNRGNETTSESGSGEPATAGSTEGGATSGEPANTDQKATSGEEGENSVATGSGSPTPTGAVEPTGESSERRSYTKL